MDRKLKLVVTALVTVAALIATGCTRSPEVRYARAMEKGKKLLKEGDHGRAAVEFQNAVQAKPKSAEGYYWVALAQLGRHNIREAIQALNRASDADPTYTAAQVKLSELMIMTHNQQLTKDAESRLQKVLTGDPSDNDALYTLAASEIRLGNPRDAEKHLGQILERSPRHLRSAVALAEMKAAQKEFPAAEQILKQAVAQMPQSSDAVAALGALYVWMGRHAEAKVNLSRAVELDPKNPSALIAFGSSQLTNGDVPGAEATFKRLAALPQREHRLSFVAFLIQQNRHPEALSELERMFNADRRDRIVRSALVASYLAGSRSSDAEKILTAALKDNKNDADALVQRGSILFTAGKYDEAQRDLNVSLHAAPSSQAHYLISKIYRDTGSPVLQKNELTEALRMSPEALRVRLELVNVLLASNNGPAALQELNGATDAQKMTAPYRLAHNWALIASGQISQARQGVDQSVAAGKTPEALLQSSVLKIGARNFVGARSDLEEVLKTNPEDLRALSTLVQLYRAQKQPAAALEKIKQSVAQRPNSAPLQMFLATWLFANHREPEGRQALAAAKGLAPKNYAADLLLAGLDIQSGRTDEARQKLMALTSSFPENIEGHMMLGDIEDSADHPAGAIAYYRKVLAIDGTNIRAMNNIAYNMSRDPNHLDDAMKYAEKAKSLSPDNPQIQDTLGWIYYRRGLYPMAVKELESALARSPSPVIKFHLGRSYEKIGKTSEGTRLIAAALAADPTLSEKSF